MQPGRLQTCIEINYEKLLRNLPAKRLLHRLLIWYTCNTQPSLAARNGYTTATAPPVSALNNLLQAFCNPPAADVLMLTIKLYEPLHINNVFLARAAIRDGICCPVSLWGLSFCSSLNFVYPRYRYKTQRLHLFNEFDIEGPAIHLASFHTTEGHD